MKPSYKTNTCIWNIIQDIDLHMMIHTEDIPVYDRIIHNTYLYMTYHKRQVVAYEKSYKTDLYMVIYTVDIPVYDRIIQNTYL